MELPLDRLATTDKKGSRIYLYPADVTGFFRTWRERLGSVLIFFFLGLPWVRLHNHQAFLLDIPNRRFIVFGVVFWAHEAPLLFLVLVGALLTLALVTAIWGRIWCGWACPQTVFIEHVFRKIERFVEGSARARREQDAAPLDSAKITKKAIKWSLFTLAALIISHSFIAYFVGTEHLAQMISASPLENPGAFIVMALVTGAVLFDFGWFREQFCTLLCPYGRFQSVLMDEASLAISYNQARGEPRRVAAAVPSGDCVNCYRCVQVCPTGIDIRRGLQMECIACTACVDACDAVMEKINRPKGLISYNASAAKHKIFRPRVLAYWGLLLACLVGLGVVLVNRSPLEQVIIRASGSPYSDGAQAKSISNHFKIELRNQSFDPQEIAFRLDPALEAAGYHVVVVNHAKYLAPGASERADLFIEFPVSTLVSGHRAIELVTQAKDLELRQEVSLVGPFSRVE